MKKKIRVFAVLLVVLLLTCLTACGEVKNDVARETAPAGDYSKNEYAYEPDGAMAEEDYAYDEPMETAPAYASSGDASQAGAVADGRKLIRTVSLSMETETFDDLLAHIQAQIAACGGYIESSQIEGNGVNGTGTRSAWMTVRVPADKLDSFLTDTKAQGYVTNVQENVSDITLNYSDVESHITALRTEQERLLEFLENAETIDEMIMIEDRLTGIRYELEYYESTKKTYDNQVDYSSVNINISEVGRITPVVEESFWESIGSGFMNTIESIWNGLKSLFAGIVIYLPVILIILVLGFILYKVILKLATGSWKRQKRDKNAPKKTAAQPPRGPMGPGPGYVPGGFPQGMSGMPNGPQSFPNAPQGQQDPVKPENAQEPAAEEKGAEE